MTLGHSTAGVARESRVVSIQRCARLERCVVWNIRSLGVFGGVCAIEYLFDVLRSEPERGIYTLQLGIALFSIAAVLRFLWNRCTLPWTYLPIAVGSMVPVAACFWLVRSSIGIVAGILMIVFEGAAFLRFWDRNSTLPALGPIALLALISPLWWALSSESPERWLVHAGAILLLMEYALALCSCASSDVRKLLSMLRRVRPRRPSGSYWWFLLLNGRHTVMSSMFTLAAILSLSAALTLLVFRFSAPRPNDPPIGDRNSLLVVVGALLMLFAYFRRRAVGLLSKMSSKAMSRVGMRQPIYVLLRSFYDDFTDAPNLFHPSFEAFVAKVMFRLGPVLALGAPRESLPPEGAFRIYATDESWQQNIERLSETAHQILLTVGDTPGLRWEFNASASLNALRKLVLLMPPDSPRRLLERWRALTHDDPSFQVLEDVIVSTLVARCTDTGVLVFLTATFPGSIEYEIALRVAALPDAEFQEIATTLGRPIGR